MYSRGTVIALAGGRGSGKTEVSTELAQKLGIPRVSFGDYVRKQAAAAGFRTEDTKALQRIGQDLVNRNPVKFVNDVLQDVHWTQGTSVVVEGIRHMEILEALRKVVSPMPVKLIFLEADALLRKSRLSARGENASAFDS